VDGLAYPLHWPMTHSCLPRGHGLPKTPSGLVTTMVGGVCRGKESFLGRHYLLEDLSSSIPVYGISH
jgi:hypothetical protein